MTQQFQIDMKIEGAEELLRSMRNTPAFNKAVTKAMMQSGHAVQREAMLAVPVDTGRLRGSIKVDHDKGGRIPSWVKIGPNVVYGAFVEFGTGIYGPLKRRIVPTSKKALAWTNKAGESFVRRSVRGMKPRPYMGPALDAARHRIDAIWQKTGTGIVARWTRGK